MKTILALAMIAIVATLAAVAVPVQMINAAVVNPAHDADNGNGNEKNFGQCKQEANNDQACIAKFK